MAAIDRSQQRLFGHSAGYDLVMSWIAGLLWLVVVFGGSLAMWIMIIKGLRHTFE